MQSEFLRERVRQAVGWGIEDAWPRYNRIHEPHDPDDESRQEWVDCITEQVVTALLRTPHDSDRQTTQWECVHGCGCVLDSRSARYHDCRTPRGEDVRESEVGPSEAEMDMARTGMAIQAIKTYRERVGCTLHEARAAIDAALRSEAQGEEGDSEPERLLYALLARLEEWHGSGWFTGASLTDLQDAAQAAHRYFAARRGEGGGG